MEMNEAISYVKPHLSKKRFEHTLRVAKTALALAETYDAPKKQVEIAAIFHDYAKYRPLDEMKRLIIESYLPKDLLNYHHELWHGPVGAILIGREYGIIDDTIRSAIHCHTTGKANMSKVDLIIFVADYCEPGRNFPGVEEVREVAHSDLLKAAWLAVRNTINYLMANNNRIYPDTFHAYNDLTEKLYGGNK